MLVGMIFDSGQAYSGRAYHDAMAAAESHHVPVVLARRGMQWTSGDSVTFEDLAPSMPLLANTGDDVNENSIVVICATMVTSAQESGGGRRVTGVADDYQQTGS